MTRRLFPYLLFLLMLACAPATLAGVGATATPGHQPTSTPRPKATAAPTALIASAVSPDEAAMRRSRGPLDARVALEVFSDFQ